MNNLRHWTIHQLLLAKADNDVLDSEAKKVKTLKFEGRSILEPYSPAKPIVGKSEVVILEKKMLLENATSNLRCNIAARSHLPFENFLT